jgi:hypothetical protein
MHMEEITLALFAASNSIRVFACVPQIHRAETDKNEASAISRTVAPRVHLTAIQVGEAASSTRT